MDDKMIKIQQIISRLNCDIVVAIPRVNPSLDELADAFREFNREKRFEMREAKEPLVITKKSQNGNISFFYAKKYKLMSDSKYMNKFIELCLNQSGGDVCILGMMYTTA